MPPIKEFDLVFVCPDRGWIFEKICRQIANYYGGHFCFHWERTQLPPSKAYFFVHYADMVVALKDNASILDKRIFVWYTHPSNYFNISDEEFFDAFNKIDRVICACSMYMRWLESKGVGKGKLAFVLGGADPNIFKPHDRSGKAVGFSMRFYPRKNPALVLALVKAMPHRNFILIGKKWEEWEKFEELKALSNFRYLDIPYSQYPRYYNEIDVFVTPSSLEGGPISLLEAMMCNAVPVACRTGFAPDIIHSGENGFIFEPESSVEEISHLIEMAYTLRADVRATIKCLTWESYARSVINIIHQ